MVGLIFCVDGGGTHTRARLTGPDGTVLAEARGGPGNVTTDPVAAAANLAACWRDAVTAAGLPHESCRGVRLAAGLAGRLSTTAFAAFEAACLPFADPLVVTDGYAALVGAGGGQPCALLVAGTGVAGHRLLPNGQSVLRDGWGWLFGDRGGAAWLGLRAVRHTLAALDGVATRGELADAVVAQVAAEASTMRAWLADMRPSSLGGLASLVFACEPRDPAAAALVEAGLTHLAALAAQLSPAPSTPLYLTGGLAPVLRPRLAARLQRDVMAPGADALHGCWLLATNQAPGENRVE